MQFLISVYCHRRAVSRTGRFAFRATNFAFDAKTFACDRVKSDRTPLESSLPPTSACWNPRDRRIQRIDADYEIAYQELAEIG